jgi:hypothetical protein
VAAAGGGGALLAERDASVRELHLITSLVERHLRRFAAPPGEDEHGDPPAADVRVPSRDIAPGFVVARQRSSTEASVSRGKELVDLDLA